jgi:hypothetical protein
MDADRFDAITRFAATSPRRRILAGLLGGAATSVGLLLRTRGAAAEPYYEDRGQACETYRDCNSPCRTCNDEGRCVYACDNAIHTCDANAQMCSPSVPQTIKGCCVCRRAGCT